MIRQIFLLGLLLALVPGASQAAGPAASGWSVPAGASVSVGGGRLELSGGSVSVAGSLDVGAGEVRSVGDFAIVGGGNVAVGTGLIEVRENWGNLGNFSAGSGSVHLVDGLALSNTILGSTRFFTLSLTTSRGETYLFQSGSEQQVAGLLRIIGSGAAIRVANSDAGSAASLNLLSGGSQSISNVGVSNVSATGQMLAPGGSNQTPGGAASGWFGAGAGFTPPAVIPASDGLSLFLLALLLAIVAMTQLRHPFRTPHPD